MKLAALCCTYNRPALLAGVVRMFELQSHSDRELVILDDAGQYDQQQGDRWQLHSTSDRYPSLGAKRNTCASLVSADVDGIVVWDDDDCYLPWHMAACAEALEREAWARPTLVIDNSPEWGDRGPILAECCLPDGKWVMLYHGAWAFRLEAFRAAGGYPEDAAGDLDCLLGRELIERFGDGADTISDRYPEPSYVYSFRHPPVRICDLGHWQRREGQATEEDYARWGVPEHVGVLRPREPEGYGHVSVELPRVGCADRDLWKQK